MKYTVDMAVIIKYYVVGGHRKNRDKLFKNRSGGFAHLRLWLVVAGSRERKYAAR